MKSKYFTLISSRKYQFLFIVFFLFYSSGNAQSNWAWKNPLSQNIVLKSANITDTIMPGSTFSEQTGISLTGVALSSTAWGDYDNDGNLDIIITGVTGMSNTNPVTKIYHNNGNNTFTEQKSIILPGIYEGKASWGDYDNDGYLDLLLVGNAGTDLNFSPISKVYHNNGDNTFTEQTSIVLKGVFQGTAAWGDYNNDGLQDILLMGTTGLEIVTKLYRNNGDNTFTEQTNTSFTNEYDGSIAWGDYDNDGNLDILICGYTGNSYATKIYRNNGDNTFTDQTAISLTNISSGSVAWGDYDNDGDLDILMSGFIGYTGVERIVKVYKNNGNNSFTELTGTSFPGLENSSVAWGDYDNDGDLDILLTGRDMTSEVAKIYRNDGFDSFIEDTNAALPNVISGEAIWGDYDNDGKLDILLTGLADYNYVAKIYKNNTSVSNSAPSVISNLQTTISGNNVIFKWNRATDGETSQNGLTYDLYIYENGKSAYKVSPQAFKQTDIKNGQRIVAQIGGIRYNSNGYTIKGLPNGNYKWSVHAIDAGLKGGKFANEQSLIIGGIASYLTVSTQTLNVNATANSTASFTITSNISWEIISNQTWLTANHVSGSNNATIALTAAANTATSPRIATITIWGLDSTSRTITVTQAAASQSISLSVSTNALIIASIASSISTFNVSSNISWTAVSDQNWLTLSKTSGSNNATITLTAEANPTTATRTAMVTVSGTGAAAQTITITQNGAASVMSMTTTKPIGSTFSFSLQANAANTPVKVDFGDSILVSKTIGTSETTISGTLVGSQTVKVYGSGITYLSCYNDQLTALDVSDNSSLTDLICSYNLLTSLDVTRNTALSYLHCGHNQLTALDITKNTALTVVKAYFNLLSTLDVTQNIALKTIDCSSNMLTSLDVTKNSGLNFLYASYNQFTTLDVTRNSALTTLSCNNNKIPTLDVSQNSLLSFLDCKNNKLSTIDVSRNSKLDMFFCSYNEFIFSTLPLKQAAWTTYSYAPQNSVSIRKDLEIGAEVDLSAHLMVNGDTTKYKWKTKNGSTLVEGVDYTFTNGKTTFLKGKADSIYCEMKNITFPDFTSDYVFKTSCAKIKLNTATEDLITSGVEIYAYQKTLYINLSYNAQVSIFDLSGRLIMSKTIEVGSTTIPMENTGIYLIKIIGNNEQLTRKVFVE